MDIHKPTNKLFPFYHHLSSMIYPQHQSILNSTQYFKLSVHLANHQIESIIFSIHKNNGTVDKVRKFQCYTIGDNDFYWLQFPDKKHFYILPESVLINDGIINNGLLEKYKKNLIVSFKDMKNIKYKEYLFHYDALDIFKIKGLFGLGV